MGRTLAVIVPAYNEEPRVAKTLTRVFEYLAGTDFDWTVWVVSDGSTDSTVSVVQQLSEAEPRLHLVEYLPNRGKGYAVRTGMMAADADWLLICDADLATPIEEVELLFETGKPVAIGSRALDRSKLEVHQPFIRELGGRVLNRIIRFLAIRGLKDTQCGFKLFKREVAKEVFSVCRLDGFSYDVEVLMIARRLGYEIAEVPVRWSHREGSKVRPLRDGLRLIRDLLKLRLTVGGSVREARAKISRIGAESG